GSVDWNADSLISSKVDRMANHGRPGSIRKSKKGPSTGTGGHGRKALEGKGPTPKAEERTYHKAYKNKQLAERSAAKRGPARPGTGARSRPQLGRGSAARRHPCQGPARCHPHRNGRPRQGVPQACS